MWFQAALLYAEEEGGGELNEPFPLAPVLQTVFLGLPSWGPDWPLDAPVDAFTVKSQDGWKVIRLNYGGVKAELKREGAFLTAFPYLYGAKIYQVHVEYDSFKRVKSLFLENLAEDDSINEGAEGVEIEALEYEGGGFFPAVLRIKNGETYFFASLYESGDEIIETWFSQESEDGGEEGGDAQVKGAAAAVAAVYTGKTIDWIKDSLVISKITRVYPEEQVLEERFFDGMGNITEIRSENGVYSALYNEKGPRYWNGLYLQWDENGLPVRLSGKNGGVLDGVFFRYEYTFDARGEWIKRLEIKMTRNGEVFIPEGYSLVTREIEY